MHIALVALGPTSLEFIAAADAAGDPKQVWDEVWTCNTFGNVIKADRIFHMDDVRVQELRKGNVKIQNMLKWLREAKPQEEGGVPIYTSRSHVGYPALVDYPLEEVINAGGSPYFNNTGAYMIAFALLPKLGVKRMDLFGFDFSFPNQHEAEKGRGCCEYWLGRAHERGIQTMPASGSTLFDANVGSPLYGYDTLDVRIRVKDNHATIKFTEKTPPTEAEIEERYDHGKAAVECSGNLL